MAVMVMRWDVRSVESRKGMTCNPSTARNAVAMSRPRKRSAGGLARFGGKQGKEETMSTTTERVTSEHVRWMIRRDMPEVLEIEQLAFEYPWSEADFIRSLRYRNTIGKVVEINNQVLGFMIYELHMRRYEVVNLAVHPSCWRRGIGSELIRQLKFTKRRNLVRAIVRESNLDGLLFFKRMGFQATDVLRGLFEFTDDDAIAMELRGGGHE